MLEVIPPPTGVTGFLWGFGPGGNNFTLTWNNYPGALCYSVYRTNDATDPFGNYVLIAECISDPRFRPQDWGLDPLDPACYVVTAITLEGETAFSTPTCVSPSIDIVPFGPFEALVGEIYSQQLSVSGLPGAPSIMFWNIYAGALPNGLTINASTGLISGVPIENGVFEFTVRVATIYNGLPSVAIRTFEIQVTTTTPPCFSDEAPLPDGQVDAAYSYTLSPDVSVAVPVWTFDSGALPDGLSFNTGTGNISGTPTTEEDTAFTISLYDGAVLLCSKELTIHIDNSCILDNANLPDGAVDSFYAYTLTPDPTVVVPVFAVTAGTLPAGIEADEFGNIFGTPLAGSEGDYTFTISLSDDAVFVCEKEFFLTINPPCIEDDATLPSGVEDVAYSHQMTAVDPGDNPSWALIFGSTPPPGMAFSSTGLLDGTPTVSGVYFMVIAFYEDGIEVCNKTFGITIDPPAPDCPTWATELVWGTETESASGAATVAFTPNTGATQATFSYSGTNTNSGSDGTMATNTGSFTYNGNGCSCQVDLTIVANTFQFPSLATGFIQISSSVAGSLLFENWAEDAPGPQNFGFSLPDTGGVDHVITVTVQGSQSGLDGAGTVQWSGVISNV